MMHDFEAYRPLLFSLAYRMTGSAADAEDIGQDAYVAYATADPAAVGVAQTFLLSTAVRLCSARLEEIRWLREDYLGPWLPEPLQTSDDLLPTISAGVGKESLTLAFLTALDGLGPEARAVYLLHDVFAFEVDAVAEIVGVAASPCHDVLARARALMAERYHPVQTDVAAARPLVEGLLGAVLKGDEAAVQEVLAPEVVYVSDAGGRVVAATRPVSGRDSVTRLLLGLLRQAPRGAAFAFEEINAGPALVVGAGGDLSNVVVFDVAGGRIQALRAVLNPDKLMYLRHQMRLRESAPAWRR